MRRVWLLPLIMLLPLGASAQDAARAPDCASVSACIAILQFFGIDPPPKPKDHFDYIDTRMLAQPVHRLATFGEPGVVALMALLKHSDSEVRMRAGYALANFDKIDPRHLDDLIRAKESGGSWLYRPIAATGTDAALAFLWAQFERDARARESSGVAASLAMFGDRLLPLLNQAFAQCRGGDEEDYCQILLSASDDMQAAPDIFMPLVQALADAPGARAGVRTSAEDWLILAKAPSARAILLKRLDSGIARIGSAGAAGFELDGTDFYSDYDWEAKFTVWDLAKYGRDAADAGPLFVKLLARRDMPEARARAALAIGEIGYAAGAPALLAQAGEFDDDWEFAYNAAESLGRLKYEPARQALERLAQSHWHKPVRNNAARALRSLNGGDFALADDLPNDGSVIIGTGMEYRFELDRTGVQTCRFDGPAVPFEQFFVDQAIWPDAAAANGVRPLELHVTPLGSLPYPGGSYDFQARHGDVRFAMKLGAGLLAGFDAGEFGGGVYVISPSGQQTQLIGDNGVAAFRAGQTAFVITGLSHMSSHGMLWVVDLAGAPTVRRRVRLPMEPSGFAFAYPETLVIKSSLGDVGVRSDGTMVNVRNIAACHAP